MLFVLSKEEPWNTTYCNEQGQVIYRVDSPWKFTNRKAKIDKTIPNSNGPYVMQDSFTRLGEVEFHALTPSVITIGGQSQGVDKFFRKGGLGWGHLGRDRIFSGPDGIEYRWVLRNTKSELYVNDEAKTLAAKFHQKRYGFLHKARPASLEIYPAAEQIADLIIITFVYIEKLRMDRERNTHGGDGGGGGGDGGG